MKLKSTMFQTKVEAVTQLVRANTSYLKQALGVFIARERPNNMGKDVDNIKMVQQIFRAARGPVTVGVVDEVFYRSPPLHPGMTASRELARVVRELASVADVAPVLKTIVRKVLKQLTFDHVDVKALCVGILDNDGHWDLLTGDARLLDYMNLLTSIVWLVLLMRGAAVKNLQIQQSNVSNRQLPGSSGMSGANKLHGAQPIPRRASQSIGMSRGHHKLGSARDGKITPASTTGAPKGKAQLGPGGPGVLSTVNSVANTPSSAAGPGASGTTTPPVPSEATGKAITVAIKAREELLQALAFVQRESILCCSNILRHFDLTGDTPFEKRLYEATVKKLLFFDIPADMQPTDHDRTCFMSTKEDIPVHEESLLYLTSLYNSCRAVDRMEALRTIESMVFRAAEGHLKREDVWRSHENDLKLYEGNGGVVGVQVKDSAFVGELLKLALVS